jgi:hypothetical protein
MSHFDAMRISNISDDRPRESNNSALSSADYDYSREYEDNYLDDRRYAMDQEAAYGSKYENFEETYDDTTESKNGEFTVNTADAQKSAPAPSIGIFAVPAALSFIRPSETKQIGGQPRPQHTPATAPQPRPRAPLSLDSKTCFRPGGSKLRRPPGRMVGRPVVDEEVRRASKVELDQQLTKSEDVKGETTNAGEVPEPEPALPLQSVAWTLIGCAVRLSFELGVLLPIVAFKECIA